MMFDQIPASLSSDPDRWLRVKIGPENPHVGAVLINTVACGFYSPHFEERSRAVCFLAHSLTASAN